MSNYQTNKTESSEKLIHDCLSSSVITIFPRNATIDRVYVSIDTLANARIFIELCEPIKAEILKKG